MTWTDGATLLAALITLTGVVLGIRGQRRMAEAAAALQRQQDAEAKQEEVTAEQIKAEGAEQDRQSREFWRFVDELKAEVARLKDDRAAQDRRLAALESLVSDLRADLDQVRHVERVGRDKVERLTAENTSLRAEVERLKAENAALHARIRGVEARQNGDAPSGPGPAGTPPAVA